VNSFVLRLVSDTAAVRRFGISKIPVSERDFTRLVMDFIREGAVPRIPVASSLWLE